MNHNEVVLLSFLGSPYISILFSGVSLSPFAYSCSLKREAETSTVGNHPTLSLSLPALPPPF